MQEAFYNGMLPEELQTGKEPNTEGLAEENCHRSDGTVIYRDQINPLDRPVG